MHEGIFDSHTPMKSLTQLQSHTRKLFPYIRRYKTAALLAVLFILFKESAVLAEPWIYRQVVSVFEQFFAEAVSKDEALRQSLILVGLFVTAQSFVVVSHYLTLRFINFLDSSVMRDAANDFVAKVLNLSFRFHSERKTGRLAQEFARGISAIENFLDAAVFNLIPLAIRLSVIFVVYFIIDWPIALVLVVMSAVFLSFTVYSSLRMQRRRQMANKLDDEGSRKAMDALMNAEAVKYFQQEKGEIATFRNMRQQWKQSKQREWDGWTLISSGQLLINVVAVTTILSIMILRLLDGELGLPNFVLVVSYMSLVIGLLWDFQHFFRDLHESFTDLNAFFLYYDQQNEIKDTSGAADLKVKTGVIQFTNVTFGYNDANHKGKIVLDNVSFTMPAGKSVAFVGPSGVGKSTIIKLLYRFYDPQSGQITVDGQNIAAVTQRSLRDALSIVPQETALFNETIAYNIAYGSGDISQQEVERVARLAHADQFIGRLPEGYNTVVGERGVKLSGGEKQRISIARAFLRNAPILVLDEATASLDSASEAEIQTALHDLMRDRTTLIIAHRLSTIMNADLIIVMNNGGVEQIGTHEELLEHGGLYNTLWELQACGYIS